MKRFVILFALIAFTTAAYAQPRAIGGRLVSGIEFSYEHALKSENMLSIDAGISYINAVEVAITHDWINPGGHDFSSVWSGRGTWNWYAGVGGAAGGAWDYYELHSRGFVGVAGRIGVEYNFWFPLQLSFDYRPVLGVDFHNSSAYFFKQGLYCGSIGLGVRYRF